MTMDELMVENGYRKEDVSSFVGMGGDEQQWGSMWTQHRAYGIGQSPMAVDISVVFSRPFERRLRCGFVRARRVGATGREKDR